MLLWIFDSKEIYDECFLVEMLMERWDPFKVHAMLIKFDMNFSSIRIYCWNFLSYTSLRSSACLNSFKNSVFSKVVTTVYGGVRDNSKKTNLDSQIGSYSLGFRVSFIWHTLSSMYLLG